MKGSYQLNYSRMKCFRYSKDGLSTVIVYLCVFGGCTSSVIELKREHFPVVAKLVFVINIFDFTCDN